MNKEYLESLVLQGLHQNVICFDDRSEAGVATIMLLAYMDDYLESEYNDELASIYIPSLANRYKVEKFAVSVIDADGLTELYLKNGGRLCGNDKHLIVGHGVKGNVVLGSC